MNIGKSQNRTEIKAYKKEIKESILNQSGQKLFVGRKIKWMQLGAGNYIKSWFSENYRTAVRELFFKHWKKNELYRPTIVINNLDEPMEDQELSKSIKKFSKISERDIPKSKKMELILEVSEKDSKLEEVKAARAYFAEKKAIVMEAMENLSIVKKNSKLYTPENIEKFQAIVKKYKDKEVKSVQDLRELQKDFAKEVTESLVAICKDDKDNLRKLESNVTTFTNNDYLMLLSPDEKKELIDIVRMARMRIEIVDIIDNAVETSGWLHSLTNVDSLNKIRTNFLNEKLEEKDLNNLKKSYAEKMINELKKISKNPEIDINKLLNT